MNSNINNSIFEAYVKSKTPIVENKQDTQQVIEEAKSKKPDFLDIDKDGNKKESMKKAAADAKKGGKDHKKGMSAKQAKFFGKKKKKAVKENVNLNADQKVLKENIRAILQKNGLTDLVTPKIIKAMLEAFALGKTVNEGSADHRKVLRLAHEQLKKSIQSLREDGHNIPKEMIEKLARMKDKLRLASHNQPEGD